ncbi:unknown [Eggerthella sp. CAG:209]|nr:unknown [Eggerthella sp. CAG:209]
MGSSIDPEASSTSTMSSGVVDVDDTLDVDERAESAVTNAESPRLMTLPLLVVIVSVDTVLSVHIRPMFAVLGVSPPRITAQSSMEDGSATEAAPPRMERPLPSSSAKAKLPPKHIRASAKAIASNGRIRFIFDPQSCFRLLANASPDAAEFFNTRGYLRTVQPTFVVRRRALQLNYRR